MLSSTEPIRKFESAAQNLVDKKLPRQMVTLTEGKQPLEQIEMVLFICNNFLPQLGYLMQSNPFWTILLLLVLRRMSNSINAEDGKSDLI